MRLRVAICVGRSARNALTDKSLVVNLFWLVASGRRWSLLEGAAPAGPASPPEAAFGGFSDPGGMVPLLLVFPPADVP